jgi:hypothetical protein
MLLKAEDQAKFSSRIVQDDSRIWASYSVEGRIKGEPVTQGDKRMFASEQEARSWLIGEAEQRGFGEIEPGFDDGSSGKGNAKAKRPNG